MKVLSRIDPLSVMKIAGVVYGCLGFLLGATFGIVVLLKVLIGNPVSADDPLSGAIGLVFGVLAIIFFPIFYGVLGALMAGLLAVIYNLVARKFGGVMFEVSEGEARRGVPVAPVTP